MRLAITGADGQLGGELLRQSRGDAIGLDLPDFDLTDPVTMRQHLSEIRPNVVINTAAYTLVDQAEDEPELCLAVNGSGVRHLAEACCALNCLLVQISSDYVFGQDRSPRKPFREEDATSPQGVYAKSKLAGERQARRCPSHLVIRTCGLYGTVGEKTAGNFVNTMLRLGRERDHMRIVDDQCCTPSYTRHVARAILFLVGSEARGIYHVVNRGVTTWFDFAAEIFRLAQIDVRLESISTREYGSRAPRPAYCALDTTHYHALPGCPALPTWQEALKEYLETRLVSEADSSR